MIIKGPLISETNNELVQDLINYENALCMYDEMQLNIFKLNSEKNISFPKWYTLTSRINNRAIEACEHFGKAILIHNGFAWNELGNRNNIGHNIKSIYDSLTPEQQKYLQFEYKKNLIGNYDDYTKIYINEYADFVRYINEWKSCDIYSLLNDDMARRGVIVTRYPGERANDEEAWKADSYKNDLFSLVEAFKNLSHKVFDENLVSEDSYPTEEEYLENLINTVGIELYNSYLSSQENHFDEGKKR